MATAVATETVLDTDMVANDGDNIAASIAIFLEHSKEKSNGIREVTREGYTKVLAEYDVTDADVKKVQKAVDHAANVAGHLAIQDLETKIAAMSAEDRADPAQRRLLEGRVRLPSHGGSTEMFVSGEAEARNPFRQGTEGEAPTLKYGQVGIKINAKSRISKELAEEAASRIKAALVADDGIVD